MRCSIVLWFALLSVHGTAQGVSQSVIGAWGGSATIGAITIEQTVGEVAVTTVESGNVRLTQGFHQADPVRVRVNVRAFLQGPFNAGTGLMNDGLRSLGLVPLTEPYTALGFPGGGEQTTISVWQVTGGDAVIDWVHVQLRSAASATTVLATRNALVQRDGDIVDVDGVSPLAFAEPAGDHYISVHHRNHLGVMSLSPVHLTSTAITVDLTNGSTPTYGTAAQASVGAVQVLWCGDVTGNGRIKYTGTGNDRDPILVAIGGVNPTATVGGYRNTDVNLDGTTKYTGTANDRDPILQSIGGTVPILTRSAQLP